MRWFVALVSLVVPATGMTGFVRALDYRRPAPPIALHRPPPPEPFFILSGPYVRRECLARLRPPAPDEAAGAGDRLCDCMVRHVLRASRHGEGRDAPRTAAIFRRRLAEAAADCGGTRRLAFLRQAARPLSSLQSHVAADDYPALALRDRAQGHVRLTLDIGPRGRVTGCQVALSSGHAALDQAACRLLRSRARFEPARDERGVAVASHYRASIAWRLPSG